jgi:hypothetical protein
MTAMEHQQHDMFQEVLQPAPGAQAAVQPDQPPARKSVFVFGSNLAGRHGAGAALHARLHHGAEYGIPFGMTGTAFGIPTKDRELRTLPIERIAHFVRKFIWWAERTPQNDYQVTRIGCGLAGYKDQDIAPLFKGAPRNCHLPEGWREIAER